MNSEKVRIGLCSRPIEMGYTGSGEHISQLYKKMEQINKKKELGLDFYYIRYNKKSMKYFKNKKEIHVSKNPFSSSIKINNYELDIVHYSPLTVIDPILCNAKFKVCTKHGAEPILTPESFSTLEYLNEKILAPRLLRKMSVVFVPSETTLQYLKKNFNLSSSKFVKTPNGISEKYKILSESEIEPILEKYGIRNPYIFHISAYSKRKNPKTMLKAFSMFSDRNPNYDFVIGGKGWNNERVNELSKSYGIQNKLNFLGYVPEKDLIKLYNGALIFIFPSLAEGFGIPNLEAMACGTPVITSNAFAIPEIVNDAAIILNNKEDPNELEKMMCRLVNNKKLREMYIQRGLKRAKIFSWEESAKKVLNTYKKLLD